MPSVLITGASTGIGRSTALWMDRKGWTVFAGVRREADGQALTDAGSDRMNPIRLDVTDRREIASAAKQIRDSVGDAGLDGLVNNAGIGGGGPLEFIDTEIIRSVFEVNVYGAVHTTQAFLPLLRVGKPGRIVNISSVGGRWAGPFLGPYHMSKWALEAYSDSLRMELVEHGIPVCVVEPGTITTAIWEKADTTIQEVQDNLNGPEEALYGDTLRAFAKVIGNQPTQGVPADRVAKVVDHALTSSRPKTRYLVGPDARLIATLRWLLPDKVFEPLIRSQLIKRQ